MFWPCSICNSQIIPFITDYVSDLKKLKNVGEWQPEYEHYKHVCSDCWKVLITKVCPICQCKFDVFKDRRTDLISNLNYHKQDDSSFSDKKIICPACFDNNSYEQCVRCKHSVLAVHNQSEKYSKDTNTRNWLLPCHPESKNDSDHASKMLCLDCFEDIKEEANKVSERYNNWTGDTKGEFLRGFQIKKEIGPIKTEEAWKDPSDVAMRLKLIAAQVGGNGYVKFFWERHQQKHEEKYVAGYGAKGNPYYKKQYWTEVWYTGCAIAVWAEKPSKKGKTKALNLIEPEFETDSTIDLGLGRKRKNWRQN